MTKSVRIENADNSSHKVRVYAEDKNAAGEWVRSTEPAQLDLPTAMITSTIWKERRLVIEEA